MTKRKTPKVHLSMPVEPTDVEQPPPKGTPAQFWSGEFGNEYTQRNRVNWQERMPFWQHIIERTGSKQLLDVGCNAGWNMLAFRQVLSAKGTSEMDIGISGVDINAEALEQAASQGLDVVNAPADTVADLFGNGVAGIAATSGVLIHIPPEELRAVMEAIVAVSSQYVLAIEYEATEETEVLYRGHTGRLWKRPFGRLYEEMGLSLVEHGEAQGFDQCHYCLLEKGA